MVWHLRIHGMEVQVLTDAKIKAAKPRAADYKLADSGQLFLHVTKAGESIGE